MATGEVKITLDDKEIVAALKLFGVSQKSINKSILNAVGIGLRKAEKATVYNHLTKRTGDLKKGIIKSLKADISVSVYSVATDNRDVRYGFILAAKGHDFLTATYQAYANSQEMYAKIDAVLNNRLKKARLK